MQLHLALRLLLLSTTILLLSTVNAWPPLGEPTECALSLISLSPCLSYISSLPDYSPTMAPSVLCCGAFFQSVAYGGATCMCYLMRDPLLLGLPVDPTRLVSLFSLCGTNHSVSASVSSWLYDICLETETLSPLSNITANSDVNSSAADALWTRGNPMANPPNPNGSERVKLDQIFRSFFMVWLMISVFQFFH
ncbi:hypothetical protein LUZ60_005362 [Juncus effusus]|nr:hypothetical protein LUZ60_005362 [Juncus effusus]